MKLYATISSERATKGQGGNEYLKIIIRDEKQHCIGYLTIRNNEINADILSEIDFKIERPIQINTNDDTKIKGKKKKGE